MIRTVLDLEMFNISYKLAMDIFTVSRNFFKKHFTYAVGSFEETKGVVELFKGPWIRII